jgi:hypothetical protein
MNTKPDYTKDVEYIGNYLQEKMVIINSVCDHLSKKWKEQNIDNVYKAITSVVAYNNSFRLKVLIESEINNVNCIFYVRQDQISYQLADYKVELKQAIQDFVLSVMGDFMENGLESLRRKVIIGERERLFYSEDKEVPKEHILVKPLLIDEKV